VKNVIDDFEGYVTEVHENTFWVRFWDQDEQEMEMEMITKKVLQDTEYLKPGIPCYWTFFSDGTFDFQLIVEFWTQEQLDKAKQEAAELMKKLNWKE